MTEYNEEHGHDDTEHELIFLNQKRLFDEMMGVSLTGHQRSQENKDQLNNVALQALQNAVTVANKIANDSADSSNAQNKQSIRHESIATDRQWNSLSDQTADLQAMASEGTIQDMVCKTMLDVMAEMEPKKA